MNQPPKHLDQDKLQLLWRAECALRPLRDQDWHQNLIICFFYHPGHIYKISMQSVHSILSNLANKTDRQTNQSYQNTTLLVRENITAKSMHRIFPATRITVSSTSPCVTSSLPPRPKFVTFNMSFFVYYKCGLVNFSILYLPILMNSGLSTYPQPPLSVNRPWFRCIGWLPVW